MAWTPPKTWTDDEAQGVAVPLWRVVGLIALASAIAWAVGAGYIGLSTLGLIVFGAWTTPKTWTAVVVTVADLNTHIRDNLNILKTSINDDGTLIHRVLDRMVSTQTFTNTAAEQTALTYSVPANTLSTNKTLSINIIGDILQNTGGTSAAHSVRIRVKYGGTTIFDATVTDLQASANRGALGCEVQLSGQNATNAQVAKGFVRLSSGVGNNAGGLALTTSEGTNNGTMLHAVHNNIAVDSTSAQNLVVTITMGTASANFTTRIHNVITRLD